MIQVRDVEDISEESLSLFTMLEPKLGKFVKLFRVFKHAFSSSEPQVLH